jgi:hypothetical protein
MESKEDIKLLTVQILRSRNIIILVVLSLILAASLMLNSGKHEIETVHAEDNQSNKNIKSLLIKLNSELIQTNRDDVTIYFVSPIGDDLNNLTIPDLRAENLPRLSIAEIGDDYFCIAYTGGEKYLFCIPFTNIASIRYSAYFE